jgi:YVTN family beta-propeller protein
LKLYVPVAGDDRVDVINTSTNEKLREIAVGSIPTSATRSIDGSKLYVTNFGSGSVTVISTITDQKIKDILIDSMAPGGLRPLNSAVSAAAPVPEGSGMLFGIASCRTGVGVLYTNSALGVAGLIDARIDQVVSAPPPAVCLNPRGIDCAPVPSPTRWPAR